MKVLVTGGAGFIGSHTVELLLARGIAVRVLDNFSAGSRRNLPAHGALEVIEGDIRERWQVTGAFDGVSHVLHLAAQISVAASVENPRESMSHNVEGFVNVLDEARRRAVRKFVFASSAAVYGRSPAMPLDEAGETIPTSPYGLEKLVDEQYASLYSSLYDLPTLGLRYFNVYGPRQPIGSAYAGVIGIFATRLREGRELDIHGDGRQVRDFVFVRDVADANCRALLTAETGCLNIASGNTHTLLDVAQVLAEISGRAPAMKFCAERLGDIRESSASVRLAREILALPAPTGLRDGLNEYWRSLCEQRCS